MAHRGPGTERMRVRTSHLRRLEQPSLVVVTAAAVAVVAIFAMTRSGIEFTSTSQPKDWTRCTNADEHYSIAYPSGWHTWGVSYESCVLFDPQPIDLSHVFMPNWDNQAGRHPDAALQVVPYESTYGYVIGSLVDRQPHKALVSRRSTRVAGHPAVAIETRSTGGGFYDKGARAYWYVIERNGKGFVVSTVAQGARAGRYAEYKRLVDRAVRTLDFSPGSRPSGLALPLALLVLVAPLVAVQVIRRRRAGESPAS